MWLVTIEDSEGMWWSDPVAGNTEEEARRIALGAGRNLPEGVALVLWKCESKGEIDRPAPEPKKRELT